MSADRRAEVTMAEIQPDEPPKQIYSRNKTKGERILSIVGQAVGIVSAALISGFFVGTVMFDRAFDARIEEFHVTAQPQIYSHVDDMITLHRLSEIHPGTMTAMSGNVTELDMRLTRLETQLEGMSQKLDEQNDLIRELIRAIQR